VTPREGQGRGQTAAAATPHRSPSTRRCGASIWQADKYPILGNADWREDELLDAEALARTEKAVMSPGDQPEFADWIAALRKPGLTGDERDQIMYAIHDLSEPDTV